MQVFSGIQSGEKSVTTTKSQFPDINCRLVVLVAPIGNAQKVYIGGPNVTAPDGTTDITTGAQLQPGDQTPEIPISNLNALWAIAGGAGTCSITYLALG